MEKENNGELFFVQFCEDDCSRKRSGERNDKSTRKSAELETIGSNRSNNHIVCRITIVFMLEKKQ